ncbi:molybdopterin-synthase adenylyltransferase MoeB [Persicirhabdus sediminis]|uniref:Molybdopterin-synthase adenylyltransferase n=1 Tax=Persicirhabdus sediminis TaxID=454144 RepID=A0A8J7MGN2_9BACT|nr:molybdopterin-synthase adenylyltransferase MoeB [Persicirhabdus sediminis]MBK1792590.1 molybdopterin-synthase adenylyltransferase MoeB [Persicirhabdus sediminis]
MSTLSKDELERYQRHFSLSEVGIQGQEKLKAASVLCIGTGGLGSPVVLYLAAAGVGKLGIIDADVVDRSNLQRQIVHGESWVGQPKVASAAARLKEINPHIELDLYECRFTAANAMEIAKHYDLIIDGTDNFPTRYLSNDVAVMLGKANIYGSIFKFEGQMSVFAAHLGGPCYRCMLPEPPEPGAVPSCAEAGVLGVLPGIIGSLQAMEAIKLIVGAGTPPLGKLLHYDSLTTSFREFNIRKDPQCPICSDQPSITELVDYDGFCGIPQPTQDPMTTSMQEIDVHQLKAKLDNGFTGTLIDVREEWEHTICNIPQAWLVPLNTFPSIIPQLKPEDEIIIHCKAGMRSAQACEFLINEGFSNVSNVIGGMMAWNQEIGS